ncbi:MAG: hypothetical protein HY673_02045 [Chloroflexi bacterium]|nr:hypothetical protein [Chloroflexota bacterium]
MSIVADSTALIAMSKIGRLDLLRKLYGNVVIPGHVYQEVVVEGKRLHKPGVGEIERAVREAWIKIVTLTEKQAQTSSGYRAAANVGRGEAEALVLAKARDLWLIVDDKHARELATILGVPFVGAAAVLLDAHLKQMLDRQEFITNLEELGKTLWLSPEIMAELLRLALESK